MFARSSATRPVPHPSSRIEHEVTYGVVVIVARVVRKAYPLLTAYLHETSDTAAMRCIHAESGAVAFASITTGDEERIGAFDPATLPGVEVSTALGSRCRGIAGSMPFTFADVLRAIAKGLLDPKGQTVRPAHRHTAVDPVAAPCRQLDAENTDIGARRQRARQRITWSRRGPDRQMSRVGRSHESFLATQQRHPRPLGIISCRHHQEGLARVKLSVLLGKMIANYPPSPVLDVANTQTLLDRPLA